MRIAIFQGPGTPGSVQDNLTHMRRVADEANARGARLLVFSEMYLTGYNIGAAAIALLAESAHGPSFEAAAAIARASGMALLYGYPEREGDAVYNAALLVDAQGKWRASYRKSHLFGEIDRAAFKAGPGGAVMVEIDGWRTGILICYDVEFPENVRALALAGADLVAVPTALMHPYAFIPRTLVPTRAFENQLYLAYANRCGSEDELRYYGESCICAPDGSDLTRAGAGEALIVADLDRDVLAASRVLNTYLADRRPDLYRTLVTPDSTENQP